MPLTLPLPVRIAAGLLATGLDRLRHLPQDLPALSVTVAGQAVRASMRVQQEIAQLAGRGDELLAVFSARPSERPQWARFDDEDGDDEGASGRVNRATAAPAEPDAPDSPDAPAPTGTPVRAHRTPAHRTGASRARRRPADPAAVGVHADGPVGPVTATSAAADPADLPGYDHLRIAQVRARLLDLDAEAVARLLGHEQAHLARAPYLTLLANRLETLQSEGAQERQA